MTFWLTHNRSIGSTKKSMQITVVILAGQAGTVRYGMKLSNRPLFSDQVRQLVVKTTMIRWPRL